MLFFFSQTKYPFPGFLSGLNKSWRKRREKKSREKNERRGRKVEVTGGKAGTQARGNHRPSCTCVSRDGGPAEASSVVMAEAGSWVKIEAFLKNEWCLAYYQASP